MTTQTTLIKTRLRAGVWEGILNAPTGEAPNITVSHLEQPLPSVEVAAVDGDAGAYHVRVPIPPDLLSDGVQTFLIADAGSGALLASFAIIAGEPAEADLRAEIDLLRAELDLLKKAFRRHCTATA